MNSDALQYLAQNTDITFLSEGSIARSLVEATNLEVSKVQEYITASYANVFLNSATGYYLDLIGQMLGLKRLPASSSSVSAEDSNVQFYVNSGGLGDYFPNPGNLNQGKISAGTSVSTEDGSIIYRTTQDIVFSRNSKQVFVPVLADQSGPAFRVGRSKLTVHSGPAGVNVTNLKPIDNGSAIESDSQYRFRLANVMASRSTANEVAIRLAALGGSDVSNVILKEFARGAGTFDALLVPVGNSVSVRTSELISKSIDNVVAFGISAKVREPEYIKFKISIQLVPADTAQLGSSDVNKIKAKNAILDYFETIKIGGELIINRLKADIINNVTSDIKDIRMLELCLNGKPHVIRNVKLKSDELFAPDNNADTEAIQVL